MNIPIQNENPIEEYVTNIFLKWLLIFCGLFLDNAKKGREILENKFIKEEVIFVMISNMDYRFHLI